jgi:glutamate-1-semialdehyde 2,1-aminomutase
MAPPGMSQSEELFARARRVIPGGVSSPLRSFSQVGGTPLFVRKAEGSRIWDADGRAYIDYLGAWGSMILGHAHREVVDAVREVARRGLSFGAPGAGEIELAERVVRLVPAIERVRFASSGTEAAMSAVRLARGFTGRSLILRFDGCLHGSADPLLSAVGGNGTGPAAGIPTGTARDSLVVPFNDLPAVEQAVGRHGADLAAVIVEPVAGHMGCVPPRKGFLDGLRELTREVGALLVFDEVLTGFRLAPGGAQHVYGVEPDLTCLGRILGGGLPAAAFGGRAEVMERLAPEGPVPQGGALSGNPLAMAAGCATLDAVTRRGSYERLEALTTRLQVGLSRAAESAGVMVTLNRVGSMISVLFCRGPVVDAASARAADAGLFARFFHALQQRGVYLPPHPLETAFVSLAHTTSDVDATVRAADEAFASLKD